jgi:hypothetical protein
VIEEKINGVENFNNTMEEGRNFFGILNGIFFQICMYFDNQVARASKQKKILRHGI